MPVPPPPDGDSLSAILTWIIAACFTAIAAMSGGFLWLISRFSNREEKVIDPLTSSVDNMADSMGDVVRSVDRVGDLVDKANQLEHDRQLLANRSRSKT